MKRRPKVKSARFDQSDLKIVGQAGPKRRAKKKCRCSTCRYWTRDSDSENTGLCDSEKFRKWPLPDGTPTMSTHCGENTIGTDAEFLCCNWSAKTSEEE